MFHPSSLRATLRVRPLKSQDLLTHPSRDQEGGGRYDAWHFWIVQNVPKYEIDFASAFILIHRVVGARLAILPLHVLQVFLHRQLLRFDLRAAGGVPFVEADEEIDDAAHTTDSGATAASAVADLVARACLPAWRRCRRRRYRSWQNGKRLGEKSRGCGGTSNTRAHGAARSCGGGFGFGFGFGGGGMDNIRISLSAGNRSRRLS